MINAQPSELWTFTHPSIQYDFIIYTTFYHIAALNTLTGDFVNYIAHRIFNTNL